jgi:hypothetical protein
MVKLVYCLRQHPDISSEELYSYWLNTHGPKVKEAAEAMRARRYVQSHTCAPELNQIFLASRGLAIDLLVNNAGYGVPGSYVNVAWDDHARFVQVMVTAVLDLTYRLLPGMLERGWGRIINIASVAGMVPSPAGHTLYGASKAFLIRFSEALAGENAPRGVNVTAVCPGFTLSEFHDVTGTRDKMNSVPGLLWLKADDVAREGYDAVMKGHSVVVNGGIYRILVWLQGALPRSLGRLVSEAAGRRYRKT